MPTTPEFQGTNPSNWEADQVVWRGALERFVERGRPVRRFAPHPTFGVLSIREWGRLVYLHNDHQLRLFGV